MAFSIRKLTKNITTKQHSFVPKISLLTLIAHRGDVLAKRRLDRAAAVGRDANRYPLLIYFVVRNCYIQ